MWFKKAAEVGEDDAQSQSAEAYEGATWLGGELGLEGDLGLVPDEEEATPCPTVFSSSVLGRERGAKSNSASPTVRQSRGVT